MVRVAQVVTRFIAGAGGVALRGALALDRSRFSVTVLAADGGTLLDQAEDAGLEVVRLRHLCPEIDPRADWLAAHELTDELGSRDFDVVHTHSAKAGALGRWTAHRLGVPAIVHTLHGFPFHEFQSPARRWAYIQVERRLGRVTNRFLAIGSQVAADAIRLGIAGPEQIRAVASAIDASAGAAANGGRPVARRLMGVPADAPVIGTVGRLDHQKAPADMVAAFERLSRPGVRFVWIGGGPLEAAVRRLVERRGLSSRFLLLGERSDVSRLLPGLDVFASSSLYEGLPCAVVEAMAAGVPVVATAVNSVPEVVVPGRTGLLVAPRAPGQLGRALEYLFDLPAEAARMAAEARVHIGARFDPDVLGRDLEETYDAALRGRRRPSSAPLARVGGAG